MANTSPTNSNVIQPANPSNFAACWAFTRAEEGGFQNISTDKGNWTGGAVGIGELRGTNFGISAASYPQLDIRNLTLATAASIYRRDYWNRVAGDSLPPGIDLMVFDEAVNAGVGASAKLLQNVVGVVADGSIGPVTLGVVNRSNDVAKFIGALADAQEQSYRADAEFAEFGEEWLGRVKRRQAAALAMVAAPAPLQVA